MTTRIRVVALCLLALAGSANTIGAQTLSGPLLYGAVPGADSPLYVIDPATGAFTTVGNIGFGITALAFHPITGELYGTQAGVPGGGPTAFDRNLIRINKLTGQGTLVGPIGLGIGGIADIAFRADGTLFGWSENTDALITINLTTGAGTLIGTDPGISTRGSGLAFNRAGTLYLAGNNGSGPLRTVNTSTGATTVGPTLTGAPHPTQPIPAMKFHPDTDELWAVNRQVAGTGTTFLIKINTTTGAITTVGATVSRLDAIAWEGGFTPPRDLYVSALSGNTVTLRWTEVLGATGYVFEGGLNPGQVLQSTPTGSALPIFSFVAPSGSFYVRMHATKGTEKTEASNEIRIHVNVPVAPSPPDMVTTAISGNTVALGWRNTFGGGAPTSIRAGVTGSWVQEFFLGAVEGQTFPAAFVLPGTYTVTLRAANAGGLSNPTAPITITVPASCPGPPQPPSKFLLYRVGGTGYAVWEPPASGPAVTSYIVNVTGAFTGSFSTTGRALSGAVGSGSYTVTVTAVNLCGSSAPTAAQTLVVP